MYKLMIVDDEDSIRHGIACSIPWQAWGYTVVALCANGLEAVEKMQQCAPDVVLSDIRMPKMDGIELMQYLNLNYPEVKIVILSGYSDFEYLNMSIKNQVTEYLLKPTDLDEFEILFKKLYDKLQAEQKHNHEYGESVVHHFQSWIDSLLKGCATAEDTKRFLPDVKARGVDFENEITVVLSVDERSGDEESSLHELKRQIVQYCNQMKTGLFLLTGDDTIVGLYGCPEDEAPAIPAVLQSIKAMQETVLAQLHATISAGVSELCTELDMLPQAYEQAKCCAKQSLFYGNESVFQFHQLEAERPEDIAYFDTDCVQKSLLSGNSTATFAEIERVFVTFEGGPVREYQFVDRMCLSLLFHVSLWGLQYNVHMEDVFRSMGTTYTDIYRCDTLLKKQEFLKALLFALQLELARRRTTRGSSVAHQMRMCVDKEFCSNAMSLEYVAERVHKNAAYVSKVFKNEIGCNFSDYLTQKRIEKALVLLADPSYKIYRIAQECGYADVSNFIKVFKKNRGISPNEYRTVMGVQHDKA